MRDSPGFFTSMFQCKNLSKLSKNIIKLWAYLLELMSVDIGSRQEIALAEESISEKQRSIVYPSTSQ